jgi:hypothetical protein
MNLFSIIVSVVCLTLERPKLHKDRDALLYKAIESLKRFSEDIDLTVEVQDCSKSQGKNRLETAAKHDSR